MYHRSSSARYQNYGYPLSSSCTGSSEKVSSRVSDEIPGLALTNGHAHGDINGSSSVKDRLKSIDTAMSWIKGELVRFLFKQKVYTRLVLRLGYGWDKLLF